VLEIVSVIFFDRLLIHIRY